MSYWRCLISPFLPTYPLTVPFPIPFQSLLSRMMSFPAARLPKWMGMETTPISSRPRVAPPSFQHQPFIQQTTTTYTSI
ncbi:hypothetical protein BDN70DRAFT_887543 [Pholiota conissans]|uniref:Uncharacterized protein n=1 Tax=Pholiota conissans TaxID=109636 RepID=A0A9P6CTC1_9AGAR|nr:hypothetical protein BDN70DRAFT_887543 [Pholiota conissans]